MELASSLDFLRCRQQELPQQSAVVPLVARTGWPNIIMTRKSWEG